MSDKHPRKRAMGRALAALALCLVACTAVERGPTGPGPTRVVSHAGRWAIVYRTVPAPVPLNEPFDVLVDVFDARDDTSRPDVELVVDAGMPHHRHGMNTVPLLSRRPDGGFLARGLLFHMSGAWTMTFDVTDDGLTERAAVVLEVP